MKKSGKSIEIPRPEWMRAGDAAIGIVRVSTAKQSDGNSPGVQSDGIRRYAADLGLDLVRVEEIHESGKDADARPEYNRALEWAKAQRVHHVIFWVIDRIG